MTLWLALWLLGCEPALDWALGCRPHVMRLGPCEVWVTFIS